MKRRILAVLLTLTMILGCFCISGSALSGEAEYSPVESNISVKSWVSATASSNSETAAAVLDDDESTVWSSAEDDAEKSVTIDLGGTYDTVRKIEIVFADSLGVYQYVIAGSTDGAEWKTIADRSGNSYQAGGFTDIFSFEGLRYIKVVVLNEGIVGIKDIKVINYVRDDLRNGSDMSEQGSNTNSYYYNAENSPAVEGFRGGAFADEGSIENGNNIFGLANDFGWDVIRLRVWNEPKNENSGAPNTRPNNCSPENTLRVAKAIAGAGMDVAIDFHYADSWSDPQNQPKPYSWAELSFDELVEATYEFTYGMIRDLNAQGTPPSIVAVGNEITNGMMWGKEYDLINGVDHHDYYNSGLYNNEWGGGIIWQYWHEDQVTPEQYQMYLDSCQRLARLVDAGVRAIRQAEADFNIDIEAEVHCAFNVVEGAEKNPLPESEKFPRVQEFITQLTSRLDSLGSHLDRIGVSYYPDWHGTWAELERNLYGITQIVPGIKVNIAECSPKVSGTVTNQANDPNHEVGFRYSVQSQGDDTAKLLQIVSDLPNNAGQGVWPWAGTNVFFSGRGTQGTAYASMKVWNDVVPTNVVESNVYTTTQPGKAPSLPSKVDNLDIETGKVSSVYVTWSDIDPAAYAEAGTFEVEGIAAVNGNMTEVKAIVTVDDAAESVSRIVEAPESAKVGEDFTVSAEIDSAYKYIKLVNEKGNVVKMTSLNSSTGERGTEWTLSAAVGTAGEGRTFKVLAKKIGGDFEDIGLTFSLDIVANNSTTGIKATVFEAGFNTASIAKNTPVRLEAVSNSYTQNIKILNENNSTMGKTLISKTSNGATIDWVYEIKIGTAGARTFSVAGAKADGVYNYDGAASASILVK